MTIITRIRDSLTGLYTKSRDPATTTATRTKREPNYFLIEITTPTGLKLRSRSKKDDVLIFGAGIVGDEATRLVERWTKT